MKDTKNKGKNIKTKVGGIVTIILSTLNAKAKLRNDVINKSLSHHSQCFNESCLFWEHVTPLGMFLLFSFLMKL